MLDEYENKLVTEISLDINMKDLQAAIAKSPREIAIAIKQAGEQAGDEIMETRGLKSYPAATSANFPPTPYYIRGRGMQYANSNDYRSERYGTQWNVKAYADKVVIGNRASYAPFVGGEKSPHHMRVKGWRRLKGVAREKVARGIIRRIYELWIARALKRAGFK